MATKAKATTRKSRVRRRGVATGSATATGGPPLVNGRGGERLAAAFEAVENYPVLAEARLRALRAARRGNPSPAELAAAVESDLGLTMIVLREANRSRGERGIGGVPAALSRLGPARAAHAIEGAPGYDFLDRAGPWGPVPEEMRQHAVATRIACERIAELAGLPSRDELAATALLHDFGRLVLFCLYGEYDRLVADVGVASEECIAVERRELGIDHALVGGVLARRMGLPPATALAIERHHAPNATGAAAAVALADLVARHGRGEPVLATRCRVLAKELGLSPPQARGLLYEYPYGLRKPRRSSEPCPLSVRELDALRGLASQKLYKEIAADMGLSPSTVRTHLHNVYRKIGASDRAQAVLIATDRGWI